MLLDKLNKVRASKTDLFTLQKRFYAELSKRFPFIMNADMAKMANKLEDELQSLLCCSLKFNSIKIPLPATNNYSNTTFKVIANVQRSQPGFYYPQSQRGKSDIHYMDTENYLKDNGDMWRKYEQRNYGMNRKVTFTKKDVLKVGLSELKNPKYAKQIIPDKVDAYFKHLREVMSYRRNFVHYINEGYGQGNGIEFKVGKLKFEMRERSFDVRTYKNDEDSHQSYSSSYGFKYKPGSDDLYRLLDYIDPGYSTFGSYVHKRLKLFIENYDAIRIKLESEEARKKKAYQTCQGFLKQIRVYTLPFKVLGELHK